MIEVIRSWSNEWKVELDGRSYYAVLRDDGDGIAYIRYQIENGRWRTLTHKTGLRWKQVTLALKQRRARGQLSR